MTATLVYSYPIPSDPVNFGVSSSDGSFSRTVSRSPMRKYIQAVVTWAWYISSGVTSARCPLPEGVGSFGKGRWCLETSLRRGGSNSERCLRVSGLLKFGEELVLRWIAYSVEAVRERPV